MGDPGLLQKIPDIPALLPQGSGDREQAITADRSLAGPPCSGKMTPLSIAHPGLD